MKYNLGGMLERNTMHTLFHTLGQFSKANPPIQFFRGEGKSENLEQGMQTQRKHMELHRDSNLSSGLNSQACHEATLSDVPPCHSKPSFKIISSLFVMRRAYIFWTDILGYLSKYLFIFLCAILF